MDIKKLAPWNWFKDEEKSEEKHLPINYVRKDYMPFTQLHQEINRVFDNVFRGFPPLGFGNDLPQTMQNVIFKPSIDIEASDKEYAITVEVAGVEEGDIKLELADNTLTIKGEKKQESEKKDKDFHRTERFYGSFQRVLSLPEDTDQENIDAQFKNGLLKISLPRKEVAKLKSKTISIKKAEA